MFIRKPVPRFCPQGPLSASGVFDLLRSYSLILLASLVLVGCANVPKGHPRIQSTAFQGYDSTTIGKYFAKAAGRHPGKSGFAIIRHPRPAFTSRVALTELAEKTLDLQYYIWEPDSTGRILAERLVRAADRGVRVRLLVDDITLAGRDAAVASLDAHANIAVSYTHLTLPTMSTTCRARGAAGG